MVTVKDVPKALKPFVFHGLQLEWEGRGTQAVADCPFCGKESKFYCSVQTGQWDCKSCMSRGNAVTFLRQLWDASEKATKDYTELATDRKLLYEETPMYWGAAKSVLTGEWLMPGHNPEGKLCQLYRLTVLQGRRALLATPDMSHQMFGMTLFDPKRSTVYVCEGPWDGMALWEVLRGTKWDEEGGYVPTGAESSSLLGDANVLAVPGSGVFPEHWAKVMEGKRVIFMYDNDHPRRNEQTDFVSRPGWDGMKKAAAALSRAESPPAEIHCIHWGDEGFDLDLEDGFDVRDGLSSTLGPIEERAGALGWLMSLVRPIPADWVRGRTAEAAKKGAPKLTTLQCDSWPVLTLSWRKAMRWTDGLDRALAVMLATVLSTKALGDQLWVRIIGPAGCGKSTLCEALSVSARHVLAKSTIRGFHSGFKSDGAGEEDNSLLELARDKTLVTKDGDTLLQAPNKEQILAEARDVYDRVSRTHYRNKMGKDYNGINMTWILCGTAGLRQLDSSELGERFLTCEIMNHIDDDMEDEVLVRVANWADRNMSYEANGHAEGQDDPERVAAKRLTGGYVDYLRDNAQRLLDSCKITEAGLRECARLGKFIAYMRARPSTKQDEAAEREFAARLVSQMVRLAKCLAVVLNRDSVDEQVMRRVRRVAMDTSTGITLDMARHLYNAGEDGVDPGALHHWTGRTEERCRVVLRFLGRIGAAEWFEKQITTGLKSKPRWRLTARVHRLYGEVMADAADSGQTIRE